MALEAVDELYAQFHDWLAADTELSLLQQRFMNKALGIYKQLLQQQGEDEAASKHFASTTYSKMAQDSPSFVSVPRGTHGAGKGGRDF